MMSRAKSRAYGRLQDYLTEPQDMPNDGHLLVLFGSTVEAILAEITNKLEFETCVSVLLRSLLETVHTEPMSPTDLQHTLNALNVNLAEPQTSDQILWYAILLFRAWAAQIAKKAPSWPDNDIPWPTETRIIPDRS